MTSSPLPEPPADTEARIIYERAVQGDAGAIVELARAYEFGSMGLSQNDAIAIQLYRQAAADGDTRAMVRLGMMHVSGHPLPKDLAEARRLYEKAADKGDVNAKANLGYLYFLGWGVPIDLAKSRQLIQPAAEKGSTATMLRLAYMLDRGMGGPTDSEGRHDGISAQHAPVILKHNTCCFPNTSAIGGTKPAWRCSVDCATRATTAVGSTVVSERRQ